MCKNENQGKCAKCKSENIDYGTSYPDGEMLYYEYVCYDCGHTGKEWYSVNYCGSE